MAVKINRRSFVNASAVASLALASSPLLARTSRSFSEYRSYDAVGLAELIRKGNASPVELLDIAIARTEAVNPKINAIVLEHFDMARKVARGKLPGGALNGVPYLLKDLGVSMAGTVTTEGSRFFANARHDKDSTIVERYRAAGLVIFGKTHSPEFGGTPSSESSLHGTTHNPWDLSRSAGGSSGGSAAAVIAGIVPMAHATDGGGSIRIPASSCGLFGMKPTRGRVPSGPDIYEGWGGLSAGHAVSRSVRDSALLLDVSQGAAIGDAYATSMRERPYMEEINRAPRQLRIALMKTPLLPVPVADDCTAAVDAAAKLCESLGHVVGIAKPELDAMALWQAFGATVNAGVALKVARREEALGRLLGSDDLEALTMLNVQNGRALSGIDHARARDTLHAASRSIGHFMQNYDVILSPTMAHVPPELGVLSLQQPYESFIGPASSASAFTALFNMTGSPSMSVPLHTTKEGMPVGVMFTGRFGDEATLFRLAAQLEAEHPWFARVPTL